MKRYTTPLLAGALASLLSSHVFAEANSAEAEELLDLSLEELISLDVPDVTSVSRKKQRLMDSAAAVYVITSEDIQRSGVTSIPEALRDGAGYASCPSKREYLVHQYTWF